MNATDSLFRLDGQIIVLTGGLGQLGRVYAAALLEHGARVAILDDRTGFVPGLPARHGKSISVIEVDVTDRAALEDALARVCTDWGVPHGLVNNAALDSPPDAPAAETGPFESYPEESWRRVLEVNATGVFLCSQVFGSAMAREGRGSVVNIGSIYGVVSPDQGLYEFRRRGGEEFFFKPVAYTASKSALYGLTRYLATYWAPRGVRVNILTLAGVFNQQPEEFLRRYEPRVPLGRMARAEEYCGGVIFLLSDASSYMTGAELRLDGGFTAW